MGDLCEGCWVTMLNADQSKPVPSHQVIRLATRPTSMRENRSALKKHHRTGARQIDPLFKSGCSARDHPASRAFGLPVDHGPDQTSSRARITADLHRAGPVRIAPNRPTPEKGGLLTQEPIAVENPAVEADARGIELRNLRKRHPGVGRPGLKVGMRQSG